MDLRSPGMPAWTPTPARELFCCRLLALLPLLCSVLPAGEPGAAPLAQAAAQVVASPSPTVERPGLAPQPAIFTTAAQIRALSVEEAKKAHPVRLQAVVTCWDSDMVLCFVQDATAGIYVQPADKADIAFGQLVEVEGKTAPGLYAPDVEEAHFRVLGPGKLPEARRVAFSRLATGAEDSQWIEVEGIIHSVDLDKGHARMKLVLPDGEITVRVPGFASSPLPSNLVAAHVRIRGACGTAMNSKRHLIGVDMLVQGLAEIEVTKMAMDPSDMPVESLSAVLGFRPQGLADRVRVQGVLTFQHQGRSFYISDGKNGVYVKSNQTNRLEVGDSLEVVGFPIRRGYSPSLEDAVFRRLGVGVSPVPVRARAAEVLSKDLDCELVRIEGYLQDATAAPGERMLVVQDGYNTVHAYLDQTLAGSRFDALAKGSRVALTGICSIEPDANNQPKGFRILLRSPSDVTVLAAPPKLTPELLRTVLFSTGAVVLLGVLWVVSLQRQVRRQTTLARRGLEKEAALEKRFADLIDHAPDMVYSHDLDGTFTSVNPAGETLLGYAPSELVGRNISLVVAPDQLALSREQLRRKLAGEQHTFYELDFIRRDGRRVMVEVSSWLLSRGGQTIGVQGIARDISERKHSEEKIRFQASLLDLAHDAIMVRDLEGCILYWNRSAERVYGWTAEEARGKSVRFLFYSDPSIFDTAVKLLLQHGEWNGELTHLTKAGQRVLVSSRWTLVCNADGQPKAVLVINADITEKKNLETHFLRAQRMESLGTLAGGIAHDLNNILVPVVMATDMLRARSKDEQDSRLLATIDTAAKRGADIVRQVLAFARGIEGQRVFLPPNYLVEEVVKIARETFPRNIEVSLEAAPDLPTVTGDLTQLHQVLLNLALNARDAMPNGGSLSFTAKSVLITGTDRELVPPAHPGPYVLFEVRDTGEGIPPEILDKVFDPFFTTKATGKGTGLGLSTALGIVRSHGGLIRVSSAVGNGTVFKVYIPASADGAAAEPVLGQKSVPQGNGELILVVDDEVSIRGTAQSALERNGYRVLTAADGREALAVFGGQKDEIALVVTDLMMPVMDGAALARALRLLVPKVIIIGASGLLPEHQVKSGARNEFAQFLDKPYRLSELLQAVHDSLHPR